MGTEQKANSAILVLCVNYDSDADARLFVHSIASCPARAEHILVISNTPESEPGGLSALNAIPGVRVLFTGSNLGYFGAAAYGLNDFLRTHSVPDWIIVSNADITFPDRQVFQKLRNQYAANAVPALVAPDIVADYAGPLSNSPSHHNPYMRDRPGAARMWAFHLITMSYTTYALYELFAKVKYTIINRFRRRDSADLHRHQPATIYAAFGAFLIFNRSYFERGGSLKYGAFLYGEELFVAESVRRLEMKIVYNPQLAVTHSHKRTSTILPSRLQARYTREAMDYLLNCFVWKK